MGVLPNIVHILYGHLAGPEPLAELPLLQYCLTSVTSSTPHYMSLYHTSSCKTLPAAQYLLLGTTDPATKLCQLLNTAC